MVYCPVTGFSRRQQLVTTCNCAESVGNSSLMQPVSWWLVNAAAQRVVTMVFHRSRWTEMASLPIQAVLPDIQQALLQRHELVLEAPPGAGKTTRVPLALLHQPWLDSGRIVMLEPRRLAAKSAATYMAESERRRRGYFRRVSWTQCRLRSGLCVDSIWSAVVQRQRSIANRCHVGNAWWSDHRRTAR